MKHDEYGTCKYNALSYFRSFCNKSRLLSNCLVLTLHSGITHAYQWIALSSFYPGLSVLVGHESWVKGLRKKSMTHSIPASTIPSDWKVPDLLALKKYNFTEHSAGAIPRVRASYILQFLVHFAAGTARNLQPLFELIKNDTKDELKKQLSDLDGCLLSQESLCTGWTVALTQLLNQGQLNIRDVLVQCKVTPVTSLAIQLVGHAGKSIDVDNESAEQADQHMCLSVHELLMYGSNENDIKGTDRLQLFQMTLQTTIAEVAIEQETQWRTRLVVAISPPEEGSGSTRGPRKGPSLLKSELLLQIDDESALLKSAADPNILLYRLPSDFKLIFGGTVGHSSTSSFSIICLFVGSFDPYLMLFKFMLLLI